MLGRLTNYEQETVINFNKGEDVAHIFTLEKTWQKHLETVRQWLEKQTGKPEGES